MKNIITILFFCSCFAAYSQTDTATVTQKSVVKKYGVSVFGGLGIGAKNFDLNTNNNWGYIKAVSARFHYGIHTINVNASQLTPAEQPIFNRVSSTSVFNMHNFGLTYGIGTYGKHFSMGCLVGVSYTNMTTVFKNVPTLDSPIYNSITYNKEKCDVVNACFGLHASLKIKYIGIGYQMYYNLLSKLPSCNASLGIEITLK
ncbi:MAG TPA: hypothetical protein VN698_00705 [Bacteroidia bacterium]|nr:hypothetical protein [Bacteroidia bacterium]